MAQARITREEKNSIDKLPPSDWPEANSVGKFLF